MLLAIVIILIVLWFLGYNPFSWVTIPDIVLFNFNNRPITLWSVLIFLAIGGAIGILPRPLRQIAAVLLALWVLSVLGVISIAGLPSLIVIAVIAGLVFSLFSSRS